MATDSDDFSPDELKDFEGVTDDERVKLERYLKWHGLKANPGNPASKSAPPKSQSALDGEIDLATIRKLMADQTALSILDHLRAQPDKSPKAAQAKGGDGKPAATGRLARFL